MNHIAQALLGLLVSGGLLTACVAASDSADEIAEPSSPVVPPETLDGTPTTLPVPPSGIGTSPTNPNASSSATTPVTTSISPVSLIDPERTPAVAGDPDWGYQQEATADFDGDGTAERAVLLANAGVMDGRAVWDDGHTWQVYIEEPDGARTYVYIRLVQLGRVEARLTPATSAQPPTIVLFERAPSHLGIYEVQYQGVNQVTIVELLGLPLDSSQGFSGTPE